ncbi:MAG: Glycerate kinase (EC [uncultured Caballeronia sp.]|nr:MAG: Glycerate kinase (EC [uncultured Caballeronia sp.]
MSLDFRQIHNSRHHAEHPTCRFFFLPPFPVVVIAPNSFKDSLSAEQVADAIASSIRRARSDVVIRIVPMADGGKGTLDAMLEAGGERGA